MTSRRQILVGLGALGIATAIWLPCVHLVFVQKESRYRSASGLPPKAAGLLCLRQRLLRASQGQRDSPPADL